MICFLIFATAPPPEPKGLSLAAIVGIGISVIVVTAVIVMLCVQIIQHHRKQMILKRLVDQVDRDIKKNPYSKLPSDGSDVQKEDDSSYVLKTDDVGLSGKVFGRKRSSKVAPSQYDS